MRTMNDENTNSLKSLFRSFDVPPDIRRPASAVSFDLEEARKSSRYEKQLLERMKHNYAVPFHQLGNKHKRQSQQIEPGKE